MSNASPARSSDTPSQWDLPSALSSLEQNTNLDALADALDPVADAAGRGRLGRWLRGEWAGHALHPAFTDLPIGCWTSAFILDVVGGHRSRPAARRLIGAGVLTVPITAATGLAEFGTIEDERSRRVAAVHGIGNVMATVFYLLSWRARRRRRHLRGVLWGLVGGGAATITGILGGHLAFARGVGVGNRRPRDGAGTEAPVPEGRRAATSGADPATGLLSEVEAAELVGVPLEQFRAMTEQGLIPPVGGDDRDGPLFDRGQVVALRLLGG